MKKVEDFKGTSRAWWMAQNPNALMVSKAELLNSSWNDTAHEVNDTGCAVALTHKREMLGVLVPAAFLYEFHRKMPHLSDLDPVLHVSQQDLKKNFDSASSHLQNGGSLVVLNQESNPQFAVVSREFAIGITTDHDGIAGFEGEMANYMFNDRILDPKEYEGAEDAFKYDGEALDDMLARTPLMSEEDAQKVQKAMDAMSNTDQSQASIHQAVQSLALE